MNELPLDQLSFEQLRRLLKTKFRVDSDSPQPVELELTEATQFRKNRSAATSANHQNYEHFSLLFAGPADRPLEQKTHSFTHDQLGTFQLFIVPVRLEQGKLYYEAVFNRTPASH
jgi:hypothetical protein